MGAANLSEWNVSEGDGTCCKVHCQTSAGCPNLPLCPRSVELGEGYVAGFGIDVHARDDRRSDLIEPTLSVDLPGEVLRVLSAGLVPVTSPPAPGWALSNAAH